MAALVASMKVSGCEEAPFAVEEWLTAAAVIAKAREQRPHQSWHGSQVVSVASMGFRGRETSPKGGASFHVCLSEHKPRLD